MYSDLYDIDDETQDDSIKYYDAEGMAAIGTYPNNPSHHIINQTIKTAASSMGACCLCASCDCHCHSSKVENNQDFVRYLFDYDIFSMPQNFSRFGYLISYLKHEGILYNCCVVTTETCSLRGPYAFPGVSKKKRITGTEQYDEQEAINTKIIRSQVGGNLQFPRPINLIEPLLETTDVRMMMRNYVLKNNATDWRDLRYGLQMPTFLIYVKLNSSTNHLPSADFTALFDLRHLRVVGSDISLGRRLAELVAGIREKYFGISLPDFSKIEQEFTNLKLDRSLQKHDDIASTSKTKRNKISPLMVSKGDNIDSQPADTSHLFVKGNRL